MMKVKQMEATQETLPVGHCDHCKQPYEITKTRVICNTCKATFCNAKCKKTAKRDHKKCTGRQRYEPPKPAPPPLPPKPVVEDERMRRLLFGDDDKYMCGYPDAQGVMQPATVPERAVEIMANCYQRRRPYYIEKVAKTAEERTIGVLRVHFDDFLTLGNCMLQNEVCPNVQWAELPEAAREAMKEHELGEEYFAMALTIGPKDGPYMCDRVVRFLYKGMV